MTPARYQHLRDLFANARQLPRDERDAWLARACADDPEALAEVRALLAGDDQTSDFLEHAPAGRVLADFADHVETRDVRRDPLQDAPRLDGFRFTRVLGRGGMGVVFEAEQIRPVHRRVAVKVIRGALDSQAARSRFASERQTLARMTHPSIATIYDAGAAADGRPYVVMELVDGPPITRYCRERDLGLRSRVQLVRDVCLALHHAHQKGVIHRDIKPNNILIAHDDGQALPKVIDFGVARGLKPEADGATVTTFGRFAGTPEYMSPEQADGELDIDTRADVYALGVLLYELLTGETPLRSRGLRELTLEQVSRALRETPPTAPSLRVASRTAPPPEAPPFPARVLRGDLDWIVLRCLEKDRQRRYDSASALAEDLRAYLDDQPVSAGPPTWRYRFGKFARRNRGLLIAAGSAATALVLGIGALSYGYLVAAAERAEAREQFTRAESALAQARSATAFLSTIIGGINPEVARGRDTTLLLDLLDDAAERAAVELRNQPEVYAQVRVAMGAALLGLARFEEAEPHLSSALQHYSTVEGPDSRNAISVQTQLAMVHVRAGRLAEARDLLTTTLARAEESLGRIDSQTAITALRWAQVQRQLNADPTDFLLDYVGDLSQSVPASDQTLLGLRAELAELQLERGEFDQAISGYEVLLDALREAYGPDAPQSVRAANNLARAYEQGGRLAESLPLAREAVARAERILGPDHADTLTARSNLGNVYTQLGRLDEAAAELEQVVSRREATLGPDHPRTLVALNNLAVAHRKAERFAEAAPLLERCWAGLKRSRGPTHIQTLVVQLNYADLLASLDRTTEAEPLAADAVAGFRDIGETARTTLGSALFTHASILRKLARFDAAEAALLESERTLSEFYPPDHTRRQAVFREFARLYRLWERPDDAALWHARINDVP